MKKAKKLIVFLMCITASLCVAAGCGGGGSSSSDGGTNSSAELRYTVTFETNGGGETASLSLLPGDAVQRPEDPSREHYTFDCWCSDAALQNEYTFGTMPAENITLYARWIPDRAVRVTFETNGGSAVEMAVAGVGDTVTEPDAPQRTGYVFGGWYTDADLTQSYDFSSAVPDSAQDFTLYAKWERDDAYCLVTYILNGETVAVVPVADGESAEPRTAEGLILDGWYTDENYTSAYDFESAVTADISLYAVGYTDGLKIANGTVTGYAGTDETVVIPAVYGGEAVTAIGSSAFMGNHTVVSVVLPDTVTSVGDYAFYDCEYLETINLSDGIQSIGKYAFYRNQRLESFGEIGGVTAIEEGTFLGCVLISAVEIPEGTRYVGAYAFAECPALAEVTLPDTVSTVGEYAFSGCVSMSTFHIPSALTSLGTGAFTDCPLNSVSVGAGNTVYSLDDGNLYTDGGRTLVLYLQADKTETSYETGTETTILEGAFANNTNLTSIVIGDGVTTIERGALGGAVNLQSLTVPYLGDGGQNLFLAYIFGAETALSNGSAGVYVPASLESLTITSSVSEVPAYAFYGCTGLKEISGLENATAYGDYAFAYTGLETFSVPASVQTVGDNAFAGCSALTAIEVAEGNATYASFDGCLYEEGLETLLLVPMNKTVISFSPSVKEIASYAFRSGRVTSVEIPDSVETIGFAAFYGCSSLESMSLPFIGGSRTENTYMLHVFGGSYTVEGSNITFSNTDVFPSSLHSIEYRGDADIPDFAFTYCQGLQEVIYGASVTRIGSYAFAQTGLTSFSLGEGVTSIGNFAFSYLMSLEGAVTVPGRIEEMGTGILAYNPYITSVTLEEGITEIGVGFMLGYSETDRTTGDTTYIASALEEINIPASVTSIGANAFTYAGYTYNASSETEEMSGVTVNFAAGSRLANIGDLAFARSGIQRIDLPASVAEVGVQAFYGCDFLETVNFGTAEEGSALENIGGMAFGYCEGLVSLNIYKEVTSSADVPAIAPYTSGSRSYNFLYGSNIPEIRVYGSELYKRQSYWSEYADSIYEIE